MIEKIAKGGGARGLAEYLLASRDSDGAERPVVAIVGGTFAGETPREIAAEFAHLRELRPTLGKAICHTSLRAAEGDRHLTADEWRQAGTTWAQGMGFQDYLIVCHGDHVHVMASRIKRDGSVVSDSNDFKRGEALVRQIERDLGLQQIASSHLLEPEKTVTHRRAPTRAEIAQHERGEATPALYVQQAIERRLLAGPCTAVEFCAALEADGITVRPNIASTGKMNGFSYEIDGVAVGSKELGRGLTWKNLEQKGISYEQDRDAEGLRSRRHLEALRGLGVGSEVTDSAQRAALGARGATAAAASAPNGGTHGRSGPGGDAARASGPGAGSALGRISSDARTSSVEGQFVEPAAERSRNGVQQHAGESQQNRTGNRRGADGHTVRDLDEHGSARPRRSDTRPSRVVDPTARHRIADLAAPVSARSERPSLGQDPRSGVDPTAGPGAGAAGGGGSRTTKAVERYVQALDAHSYDVTIVRPNGVADRRPGLTPTQLRAQLPWLRRENARGAHIYARPAGTAFVLLDDLPVAQLPRMKAEGLEPAIVLETSRGNYAAWVKVGAGLTPDENSAVARTLARRYGADPASTDAVHLSRLPGFTNQKPERQDEAGFAPYVLVREAWGKVCTRAAELRDWAKEVVEVRRREAAIGRATPASEIPWSPSTDPADAYRRLAAAARKRDPEGTKNLSFLDYRVAQDLARSGFREPQIAAAIAAASPHVAERKVGHVTDYAERTASKAFQSVRPAQTHDNQAAQEAYEEGSKIDPDADPTSKVVRKRQRDSDHDFSPGY